MAKAITLIRRCLLLVCLCGVATVSIAQIPSTPLDLDPVVASEVSLVEYPNLDQEDNDLADSITSRFKTSKDVALKIVRLAGEYAYDVFPTKTDILTIIEMESSFKETARYGDCFGLMMIKRKYHPEGTKGPEANIRTGAQMLNDHYLTLGSVKAAIIAFNAGVGSYQKRRYTLKYYLKYIRLRTNYLVN